MPPEEYDNAHQENVEETPKRGEDPARPEASGSGREAAPAERQAGAPAGDDSDERPADDASGHEETSLAERSERLAGRSRMLHRGSDQLIQYSTEKNRDAESAARDRKHCLARKRGAESVARRRETPGHEADECFAEEDERARIEASCLHRPIRALQSRKEQLNNQFEFLVRMLADARYGSHDFMDQVEKELGALDVKLSEIEDLLESLSLRISDHTLTTRPENEIHCDPDGFVEY